MERNSHLIRLSDRDSDLLRNFQRQLPHLINTKHVGSQSDVVVFCLHFTAQSIRNLTFRDACKVFDPDPNTAIIKLSEIVSYQ